MPFLVLVIESFAPPLAAGRHMGSVRLYVSLLSGLAFIILFGSCSNVNFEKGTNTNGAGGPCNGSAMACTSNPTSGVNDYDLDYTIPTAKANVLFVVDNSLSMGSDQAKLGSAFGDLDSSLGHVDWQVGITTTDMSGLGAGGQLVSIGGNSIINKGTSNYSSLFNSTISGQGEGGSNDERGLLSALTLIRNNPNGFVRPDSHTAIVILSDEDERSLGRISQPHQTPDPDLELNSDERPEGFATALNAALGGKGHSMYSIIIRPGDEGCLNAQFEPGRVGYYGQRYFEAQSIIHKRITGADLNPLASPEIGNICESDFSGIMSIIGASIKNKIEPITLPCAPIGGRVEVNGNSVQISGRQVMPPNPTPGVTVHLKFSCNP